MGVKEIIKTQEGDTVRVSVVTDQGNVATSHYEVYNTEPVKDDAVTDAISRATSMDE